MRTEGRVLALRRENTFYREHILERKEEKKKYWPCAAQRRGLCHIIIHTMSHHHTYYVTSSYILCHIYWSCAAQRRGHQAPACSPNMPAPQTSTSRLQTSKNQCGIFRVTLSQRERERVCVCVSLSLSFSVSLPLCLSLCLCLCLSLKTEREILKRQHLRHRLFYVSIEDIDPFVYVVTTP